uniref:Endophilin-B1 n=1 Tax=Aceria tosichella TaxID=561515 RepID=A0A6G1SA05_9ACAR
MDFLPKGLKDIAAASATALNRAVQFTEERLGHSERTELDAYFENLLSRAEQIKSWTEKIVTSAEAVLQPNPGTRVEDYLIEKLAVTEKRKERLRNLEWLGSNMVAAGQELTPGDTYGSALIKCGQTQLKLGQVEREFANKADKEFIKPLKKFLDEDAKTLSKEKRLLEVKRLDLDAAKSKVKKVRSTDQPQASNVSRSIGLMNIALLLWQELLHSQ